MKMKLNELKNKKILILGVQKEGMSSFKFLRKLFPDKILGLADKTPVIEMLKLPQKDRAEIKKDKKVRFHLGKNYLSALSKYDVIIKTPGIPLKIIKPFLKKGQKVTSQTEIFFANCPGVIVGITGTKGKGTTASLIYKILEQERLRVRLVGNIGKPVLSFLKQAKKDDVFVCELSSHQLQNLRQSPQIAVFLNLYPAHLDYYRDFEEYKKAKASITLFQNKRDSFIYNKNQKFLRDLAKKTKAQKFAFGVDSKSLDCYLKDDWLFYKEQKIIKANQVPLIGEFNLQNVMAGIVVGKLFGVPSKAIKMAIKKFKPLPHRLEFVGKFRGIEFYNDSLATVPEATVSAIEALKQRLQTIILGGYEAKQNFDGLAKRILETKIKKLIFFPPTGKRIWQAILETSKSTNSKKIEPYFVENMKEAVSIAFEQTDRERICLLSCACPSFGVFKNYKERGNLFKKFVRSYGKKTA